MTVSLDVIKSLQTMLSHATRWVARPCTRCVRKGQAEQCCEGQRKKAKYLMTESELGELPHVSTLDLGRDD